MAAFGMEVMSESGVRSCCCGQGEISAMWRWHAQIIENDGEESVAWARQKMAWSARKMTPSRRQRVSRRAALGAAAAPAKRHRRALGAAHRISIA